MVFQVRLVFKRLVRETGEGQTDGWMDAWTCKKESRTCHLVTHLAGKWPLIAVNSFVFFQVWSSNE